MNVILFSIPMAKRSLFYKFFLLLLHLQNASCDTFSVLGTCKPHEIFKNVEAAQFLSSIFLILRLFISSFKSVTV